DVADDHPRVLGHLGHGLDELLAPLLGRRGQAQPDQLAVVHRAQTEVGLLDGLLDGADLAGLPRLNDQRAGIGRRHGGHLADRRQVAVIVHPDAVEQRGGRAAGPYRGELTPQPVQGRVHAGLHILQHGLHDDLLSLTQGDPEEGSPLSTDPSWAPGQTDVTMEPTGSPQTIRRMFPGRVRSNTTIGSLFSMQREMAVVSITSSRRFSTSMYVIVGSRTAL